MERFRVEEKQRFRQRLRHATRRRRGADVSEIRRSLQLIVSGAEAVQMRALVVVLRDSTVTVVLPFTAPAVGTSVFSNELAMQPPEVVHIFWRVVDSTNPTRLVGQLNENVSLCGW